MQKTKAQKSRPRLIQAMVDAFSLPDLRKRILITIGIVLIFRILAHVPLPGVDHTKLIEFFGGNNSFGIIDVFSGGAFSNFSIVSLGVYPYITATIIMQLMTPVIPKLQALSQEGEAGRNKINLISHYLTIPLAVASTFGTIAVLTAKGVIPADVAPLTIATIVICMTAGTLLLVWMGEQITSYGIGNGISIIIFAGIVATLPSTLGQSFLTVQSGNILPLILFGVLALAVIILIVIFTEAVRRLPVQYAKTQIKSGRMYRSGGSTFLPLKVNTAGMIPLIFGMALMNLPTMAASFFVAPDGATPNFWNHIQTNFSGTSGTAWDALFWGIFAIMVLVAAFVYTRVVFEQQDLPGNLQRNGGFIPGIRPGKQTKTYLDGVIGRITWGGATFLAFVAVTPVLIGFATGVAITLSAFSMLIVVGVALDTMKQIEAQLVMRKYDGFIK